MKRGAWPAVLLFLSTSLAPAFADDGPRVWPKPPAADSAGAAKVLEADRLLHEEDDTQKNLFAAIELYAQAVKAGLSDADGARAKGHQALAYLRLGDLQKDGDDKLRYYELGTRAADEGLKKDKACADAWFYRGATLGRWGETKGVLKALFLLEDVKGAMNTALKLDPDHADAMLALGKIDEAVPGFAGGSKERAEKSYRKALKMDPHFTRAMLDLASLLADEDKEQDAKDLCNAVLNEKAPSRKGEWRKFDVPRAKALLKELED